LDEEKSKFSGLARKIVWLSIIAQFAAVVKLACAAEKKSVINLIRVLLSVTD
jgi:hypothetical protein